METIIIGYIELLIDSFINPQKRVFVGYLLSALLIALLVQSITAKSSIRTSLSETFAKRIWLSRSACTDYLVLLINQALMMGIVPRLISKIVVTTILFEYLHILFDGRVLLWPNIPGWTIAVLFTISLFLLDDAAKYLIHRLLHRCPLLWAFHKVHHTAETLTPITVYRTHPVEGIVFAFRSIAVQAVVVAGFLFFFGDRTELVTILGANAILFFFNVFGANLRHSHIWISYGRFIEHFFISPAQHQIHHSCAQQHHDRNFGAVLAIWDWIGGSLYITGGKEHIQFGMGHTSKTYHSLRSIYLVPCIEAIQCLSRPLKKAFVKMINISSIVHRSTPTAALLAFVISGFLPIAEARGDAMELNIYSHRQPFLIKPFIEAYKAQTGTKINIVFASKGLAQRLQAEGSRSPADVILTVDIARLNVYADKDLLAPVDSEILRANIPAHLRDPQNRWFAFSKRARVIAVANRAEDTRSISNYEDLAASKWRGRICARPGSHVYNRALVASIINADGVLAAEKWAKGVVENLARRPQGNDRAQVKAMYEGVCDSAIINNYYFGKLKYSDKAAQRKWAEAVHIIFPNQKNRGTHVNISGGGVAKYSRNKAEAVRFMEFLTGAKAQNLYGTINFEYPVNAKVAPSKELASWGEFNEDKMPIARIAELASDAQKVIDRVGW